MTRNRQRDGSRPGLGGWRAAAASALLLVAASAAADSEPTASDRTSTSASAAMLTRWSGRAGGLPPFTSVTPASLASAFEAAVDERRAAVRRIAGNSVPATFDNTVAALEDAARRTRNLSSLFSLYANNMATGAMPEVTKRLAPLVPALDDEIAHDDALFARLEAVYRSRHRGRLATDQVRLTELLHEQFLRRGAGQSPQRKARLEEINRRLATLEAQFNRNLRADESAGVVFIEDEAGLAGLSSSTRAAAAEQATAKGRAGIWAVPNARPAVWPFLQTSDRRDLREQVWRMWTERGDHDGESDNKPVISEMLRLRGERARLLGYPDFAHLALADRMAKTPDTALTLLKDVWDRVLPPTQALLTDLQSIAHREGADIALAPWDRLYYTEKLRHERFGFRSEDVKPYLELDSVLAAIFWAAGRVHGLEFRELHDAPVWHADVRAFEVRQGGEPFGYVYFDLFRRDGKGRGSSTSELRSAESFRGKVLPIALFYSSIERPADGGKALLTLEEANVWFHEFGHALHMLSNTTRYPSLGSLAVPWDFVEVPALLNERWFHDPELLRRFARHYQTGAPIPDALIEGFERAARFERVFSLNLDYLAPATVDLEMHLLADGRDIDAVALERKVLMDLGMPAAWDEIMRVPHSVHSFSAGYAAGVYSYLWADVIAADIADAFVLSPGGLYDPDTARRWRETMLAVGTSVPIDEAFRRFRGRDPTPRALLERFGLDATPTDPGKTAASH